MLGCLVKDVRRPSLQAPASSVPWGYTADSYSSYLCRRDDSGTSRPGSQVHTKVPARSDGHRQAWLLINGFDYATKRSGEDFLGFTKVTGGFDCNNIVCM